MFTSLDCVVCGQKNYRLQNIQLSKNFAVRLRVRQISFVRRVRGDDRAGGAVKLLVENTGIEPVTSWLQTRRSPS